MNVVIFSDQNPITTLVEVREGQNGIVVLDYYFSNAVRPHHLQEIKKKKRYVILGSIRKLIGYLDIDSNI